MSATKAVIFDLDGTLLDHEEASASALRQWLPHLGVPTERIADLVPLWLACENRHYPAWRAGEISFQEQRRRRLRDFLPGIGVAVAEPELDELFEGYLVGYEASWAAYPDAEQALRMVRDAGLLVGVLTNGDQDQQTCKLEAIGLRHLCGPVFASSALGAAKPDPLAYARVCTHLNVQPHEAVMVGDNHDLDVLAARGADLMAVHLDRGGSEPSDPHRIQTLHELAQVLALR